MLELRDYQIEAKNTIVAWSKSNPTVIPTLVGVMSSGKTGVSCAAIGALVEEAKLDAKRKGLHSPQYHIWVIVNRGELVKQWRKELERFAPQLQTHHRDVGLIWGKQPKALHRPVQLVMVQTLVHQLKNIQDKYAPDLVIYDEAHETCSFDITNVLKQRWQHVKQINLTATPVYHGKSNVQYSDLFLKSHWYVMKTAKEMVHEKLWKRPIWAPVDAALAEKTAIRFSGMKINKGREEYDDTSQAAVMIDLLDEHLGVALPKVGDRSTMWFVVNTAHGKETYARLAQRGLKAAFISGDEKETCTNVKLEKKTDQRSEIVAACQTGAIKHLVTIQTATTGFDCPIMSCAVWLRRTLSVGLWNQMAGRVLRKFDGIEDALMLDLAGNLSLHPFPEEMDFLDYNPCMKMFRDPKKVMCQACNHRHDAIPTPVHPIDRRISWLTGQALFKDGREVSLKTVISCHSCKASVYADTETLAAYGLWQKSCRSAKMAGQKPPQYDRASAGISIGTATDQCQTPLTIELLYELGIWRLSSGGEAEVQIKDRSDEYREMLIKIAKNYSRKELCDQRFELLTPKQQRFILNCHTAKLKEIENHADRYRGAIGAAYCSDRSFVWASQYWGEANGMIPKSEVVKAFKAIWQGNPSVYALLEQWLEQHCEKHKEDGQMKKYGAVRDALKLLQGLTWENQIAA